MKKALVILLLIAGVWLWLRESPPSQLINPLGATPTLAPHKTITVNDNVYAYAVSTVYDPNQLKLIPNYVEQKTSKDLVQSYACQLAINGGFYDENNRPLGLVIADGLLIHNARANSLLNGFFSLSASGSSRIDYTLHFDDNLALQSGPIVIIDGEPVDLRLTDDKTSRRMVVALNDTSVVFVSVFNPVVEVLGPRLDDLPDILMAISETEKLELDSAINLDGGKASAFYSPDTILSEVTPVGSLLCMR